MADLLRHACDRMIAAFGSGAAFSLVSGMAGTDPVMGAFSTGVVFALLQGGLFQVTLSVLHLEQSLSSLVC